MLQTVSLLGVLLAAAPLPVRWSDAPHRVVARIAESRLGAPARAEARRLLHGASLADVSTWADDIRGRRPNTSNWHYVNIPVTDSVYRAREQCPRGCIIRAYEAQLAILRDPGRSRAERADALRFVVHLVADIHSPMHAGDRGDRGGNDLVVWHRNRRTNLHAFWDSGLLRAASLDERALQRRVEDRIRSATNLDLVSGGSVVEWAIESHGVARDLAYRLLPDDYRIDAAYVDAALPVLEDRLTRAALRLAAVLNHALVPAGQPGD
jgi:hypothetical protein